jgi:thiol-disulfide isomerase/thioredoxin
MKKIILLAMAGFLAACSSTGTENSTKADYNPKNGMWRATISLNDSIDLPFNFSLTGGDSAYTISIYNSDEKIEVQDISWVGDSLKIQMPVFANYLLVKPGHMSLEGYYINPDAENYRLPFKAVYGDSSRFEVTAKNCCDINRKWAVEFAPEDDKRDPAIAYFEQEGSQISGTFLTETGDYRYLQGVLSGTNLQLSAFDGAHLFYFEATIEDGQEMMGRFYSGRSFMESWKAYRDDEFELRNADSLTFLKEGYDKFSFSFKDLNGNQVSLEDPQFAGKPVIVQIMGSWCPNCMDESRYLREIYKEFHPKGLQIVGLTFERVKDEETATKRALKMVDNLSIPYPVLLAGSTRDDKAAELLPSLNHVMSYPTAIYLNPDHSIKKIHTGFSGPGTPVYEKFVEENKKTLDEMIEKL